MAAGFSQKRPGLPAQQEIREAGAPNAETLGHADESTRPVNVPCSPAVLGHFLPTFGP